MPEKVIAILPTAERKPVVRLNMPLAPIEMLLVLGMIIWGTHYSVAKAALSVLPPFLFNALRFSAAVATLYLIMRASSESFALKRSAILRLIFTSFLLHVLYQVFFINGLRYTTVANSVLISTIAPVGVIIVNILLRRERGSWRLFSGMSLAFGGVLIVILSRYADQIGLGTPTTLLGDALTVIGTFIWVGMTFSLRTLMTDNPVIPTSFWLLLCGTVLDACIAIPETLHFDWSLLTWEVGLAVLYSGVVSIGIGGAIWNLALKRIGASRTASFLNLQPIVAAFVAVIFLGEPFTLWLVLGIGLVIVGMTRLRIG
ncbi:MAG: DMT family transporter [Anaerolineae bacterium]|nr:DMT family transporter [Anaerolineae bacterium]